VLSKSQVVLPEEHGTIASSGCRAGRPLFPDETGVAPAALGGDDGTAEVLIVKKAGKCLLLAWGVLKSELRLQKAISEHDCINLNPSSASFTPHQKGSE